MTTDAHAGVAVRVALTFDAEHPDRAAPAGRSPRAILDVLAGPRRPARRGSSRAAGSRPHPDARPAGRGRRPPRRQSQLLPRPPAAPDRRRHPDRRPGGGAGHPRDRRRRSAALVPLPVLGRVRRPARPRHPRGSATATSARTSSSRTGSRRGRARAGRRRAARHVPAVGDAAVVLFHAWPPGHARRAAGVIDGLRALGRAVRPDRRARAVGSAGTRSARTTAGGPCRRRRQLQGRRRARRRGRDAARGRSRTDDLAPGRPLAEAHAALARARRARPGRRRVTGRWVPADRRPLPRRRRLPGATSATCERAFADGRAGRRDPRPERHVRRSPGRRDAGRGASP